MLIRKIRGRSAIAILTGFLALLASSSAWGQIIIDANVFRNQDTASTTVSTPVFSTTSGNELLLAFVSTDYLSGTNTTVTRITGGSLTWVLVLRTNSQRGTAEIWRAFSSSVLSSVAITATLSQSVVSSMTVLSFAGVNASGNNGAGAIGATKSGSASSGSPTVTLITTQNGSWVFGVGNDWDNAIGRTPGANQTLVHQDLAPVQDTYWVQMKNAPTPLSGTSVTINDTAPTTDRYNLSIVEVLAAQGGGGSTFSISGNVGPTAALGSGTLLTLSGNGSNATATADSSGNYNFSNLRAGTYTITPSKSGQTFTPPNLSVSISTANQTGQNFTMQTWSITGTIGPDVNSGTGTLMTLSGPVNATATADTSGNYGFTTLPNGTYTLTPSKAGYTFMPANQSVPVSGANVPKINFTATVVPTWTISGTISPLQFGPGTLLTLSGTPSMTTTADSSGNYRFTGLSNGTYTITPSKTGYTFMPLNQSVPVNGANVPGINFTAQASGPPLYYPDLSDIIPSSKMSISGSGSGAVFQYTHDTYNGGPGPLVIQPTYNPATGTYQGTQYIYSYNSSTGTWTLSQQIPVAGAFIFDADHGHFHFPFTSYGLYTVAADGSPGSPVAISGKISFCITDSFIYSPSLPNAGALGNLGSCSDPTSLRGLDIGAVDEYDQSDAGQSISIAGVPDGTYWLRAVVDPDDFLAEADKSNNETDVKISISSGTVTVLQTVSPVLPAPPNISMTSPANGTRVSGTVQLTATTSTTTGVQYLLDGEPLGSLVSAAPYTLSWDSTTVPNGTHWLAAQTTGSAGRIGTSAVVSVTVSNSSTTPPQVSISSPTNGSTVSAVVALMAQAASGAGIASVSFYLDNQPLGSPVTAPPYLAYWDTEASTGGQHVLTAFALDSTGNSATSAPVTVTVDNSHPPNAIGEDVNLSVDGVGTMTTPAFSTGDYDFLVAFVAYDGPSNAPQTATVSGAGLAWKLLMRSNNQKGTAEIWAVRGGEAASGLTVIAQPGVGPSYHGSLTVIGFTNAAGPGVVGQASAPSGAPDIFLPGVAAGNWVFAVGNDWDNPIARAPVSGQVLVHQRLDNQVGDTYWVQSTSAPSTAFGLVDIHDNAPTTDEWNYAAVEIVATRQ